MRLWQLAEKVSSPPMNLSHECGVKSWESLKLFDGNMIDLTSLSNW